MGNRTISTRVWVEFRDAAVLSVIHLQQHRQSTLPPGSPKPALFANTWLQTRRGSKYRNAFSPQNEALCTDHKQKCTLVLWEPQAIKFTEETLQLRLFFQMQIRDVPVIKYFSGQISVSKTTSRPSPLYFWIPLFSSYLLFTASCTDFPEQSRSTLPFPTFTRTEVIQRLMSNLHFWAKALWEWVKFTPLASREYAGRKVHTGRRSPWQRTLPGVQWHNQTQTRVSKAEIPTIISCFLAIPNISTLSSQRQHLQGRVLLVK